MDQLMMGWAGQVPADGVAVPMLHQVPAVIAATGPAGSHAFIEFFVATLRNPNTRTAYAKAVAKFLDWMLTLRR